MTTDTANVYGAYNTMAPLSTNGDCLVSSATVTQTTAQQNQPVFTLFSHPGIPAPEWRHRRPGNRSPSRPISR